MLLIGYSSLSIMIGTLQKIQKKILTSNVYRDHKQHRSMDANEPQSLKMTRLYLQTLLPREGLLPNNKPSYQSLSAKINLSLAKSNTFLWVHIKSISNSMRQSRKVMDSSPYSPIAPVFVIKIGNPSKPSKFLKIS